jgi:predicted nicotinamide N-methyase
MKTFKYNLNIYQFSPGIELLIPDSADVKSDYDQTASADNTLLFPFWTRIWPAALAMSKYLLEENNWVANRHILELGAGIGLPSFTAAQFAKSVVVSDADADAVELLNKNIQSMNLQNVSARQVNWNAHIIPYPYIDTLLLSDVCYDPAQYDQLVRLILSYKEQGTDVLITAPKRISTASFHALLAQWIKQAFIRNINDVEVALFTL